VTCGATHATNNILYVVLHWPYGPSLSPSSLEGDTGQTKAPWQSEGVELDSAANFLPFCCSVILSCFTMPLKYSITNDNKKIYCVKTAGNTNLQHRFCVKKVISSYADYYCTPVVTNRTVLL